MPDIGEHLFVRPPVEGLELEVVPLLLLLLLLAADSLGDLFLLGDGSLNLSSGETLLLAVCAGGVKQNIVDRVDSSGGLYMEGTKQVRKRQG